MAYIYLDELEKILPGILDSWIDKDDESWEWIFSEIEQKCYVGMKKKDKKKWKTKIESMVNAHTTIIAAHRNDINELNEKVDELKKYVTDNLSPRINGLSKDVEIAKTLANIAKQRTEVNYDQISKAKNDADIIQDVYNRMAGRGATREELDGFRDLIHKYDALEKKEIPVNYSNPEDKDCKTCKYYRNWYSIQDDMCIKCDAYQYWEKKEEPNKSCTNCKYYSNKNGIYNCTCPNGSCGLDNKNWEAKDE